MTYKTNESLKFQYQPLYHLSLSPPDSNFVPIISHFLLAECFKMTANIDKVHSIPQYTAVTDITGA